MDNYKGAEIPDEIFDWLGLYPFSSLTTVQQQTVAQHLSEGEYEGMRKTVLSISTVDYYPPFADSAAKANIMHHFDSVHVKHRGKIIPLTIWRAAAVMLFCLSGILGVLLSKHKSHSVALVPGKTDTIFVTKIINPTANKAVGVVIKRDPVQRKLPASHTLAPIKAMHFAAQETIVPDELTIVTTRESGNTLNRNKGNSIKDDSFARNFHYVSL